MKPKHEYRNTVNANLRDEVYHFYTTAWNWSGDTFVGLKAAFCSIRGTVRGKRPLRVYVTLLVVDDEDDAVCYVKADLPRGGGG